MTLTRNRVFSQAQSHRGLHSSCHSVPAVSDQTPCAANANANVQGSPSELPVLVYSRRLQGSPSELPSPDTPSRQTSPRCKVQVLFLVVGARHLCQEGSLSRAGVALARQCKPSGPRMTSPSSWLQEAARSLVS